MMEPKNWNKCCQVLPIGEDPGSFPAGHQGGKQAQN